MVPEMTPGMTRRMTRRRQRIYAIILIMVGVISATGLSLYALRDKVTFFYSPSDIIGPQAKYIAPDRPFRLGGLVIYGTVERDGKMVRFSVTDNIQDIPVLYKGIPPNLFREGQGIIATGKLDDTGTFIATELLAKHDENYMPPEVARALKKTEGQKQHGEIP